MILATKFIQVYLKVVCVLIKAVRFHYMQCRTSIISVLIAERSRLDIIHVIVVVISYIAVIVVTTIIIPSLKLHSQISTGMI